MPFKPRVRRAAEGGFPQHTPEHDESFPGKALSSEQLRLLQWTKLKNYFPDYLHPDWADLETGPAAFQSWMAELVPATHLGWVSRDNPSRLWEPKNCAVIRTPTLELGQPFEIYLGCGRALLPLRLASRILCIPPTEMLELKLKVLLDDLVITEALHRMLRPRSMWPVIEVAKGRRARVRVS